MNRQFKVKGVTGIETYIDILAKSDGGYEVRISSITEHGTRESCEFISEDLLESCIRTGYLTEIKKPARTMAASA